MASVSTYPVLGPACLPLCRSYTRTSLSTCLQQCALAETCLPVKSNLQEDKSVSLCLFSRLHRDKLFYLYEVGYATFKQ
jgi:hypothetical protein